MLPYTTGNNNYKFINGLTVDPSNQSQNIQCIMIIINDATITTGITPVLFNQGSPNNVAIVGVYEVAGRLLFYGQWNSLGTYTAPGNVPAPTTECGCITSIQLSSPTTITPLYGAMNFHSGVRLTMLPGGARVNVITQATSLAPDMIIIIAGAFDGLNGQYPTTGMKNIVVYNFAANQGYYNPDELATNAPVSGYEGEVLCCVVVGSHCCFGGKFTLVGETTPSLPQYYGTYVFTSLTVGSWLGGPVTQLTGPVQYTIAASNPALTLIQGAFGTFGAPNAGLAYIDPANLTATHINISPLATTAAWIDARKGLTLANLVADPTNNPTAPAVVCEVCIFNDTTAGAVSFRNAGASLTGSWGLNPPPTGRVTNESIVQLQNGGGYTSTNGLHALGNNLYKLIQDV